MKKADNRVVRYGAHVTICKIDRLVMRTLSHVVLAAVVLIGCYRNGRDRDVDSGLRSERGRRARGGHGAIARMENGGSADTETW